MSDVNIAGFRRTATENTGLLGPLVTTGDTANRYAGGKDVITATVTDAGDTTILTPASGNSIRLFWIAAINDPGSMSTPLIKVSLGNLEIYRVYALSHWEVFDGAVDAPLTINLEEAASVAVTVHYQEL